MARRALHVRTRWLVLTGPTAAFLGLLVAVGSPAPAAADESTYVVQERLYAMRHELAVAGGVLPLDAFYKGLTVEGAYALHFADAFAWEVARFAYTFQVETDLAGELHDNFGVEPTAFDRIRYFALSSFVFKPLYGKWSLLNRAVLRDEAFLTVSGGIVKLTDTPADSFQPVVGAGIGVRIFVTDWLSVRIDVRDFVYFDGAEATNVLHISLGPSLNL